MASIFDILAKPLALPTATPSVPTPLPAFKPAPGLFDTQPISTTLPPANRTTRPQTFQDIKELITPNYGYTKQEIASAVPTYKEKVLAPYKSIGSITSGLGSIIGQLPGVSNIFDAIAKTKVGGYLADLGAKQAEAVRVKSPAEAKARQLPDTVIGVAGFLTGESEVAKLIARSSRPEEISSHLIQAIPNLSKTEADALAPLFAPVSNVEDVQSMLRKVDYAKNKTPIVGSAAQESGKVASLPAQKTVVGPLPAYTGQTDLTLKTLDALKGRTTVSKQFISDLTNSGDIKQAERDTIRKVLDQYPNGQDVPVKEFADKVHTELLPLERSKPGEFNNGDYKSNRHEGTTLPAEIRGPIANYNEHIYESPIKTSAGRTHFSTDAPNYFAHTRVEDLAKEPKVMTAGDGGPRPDLYTEGTTRRVIEIQSDLFQKGGLQNELNVIPKDYPTSPVQPAKPGSKRFKEIAKLEPYRNTWQDRIIKEEVKQAAIDGKTKLQFPTGETAMKIEGLGTNVQFYDAPNSIAKPENLKVGVELSSGNPADRYVNRGSAKWIVTEVLGDGKFKAVPKYMYENITTSKYPAPPNVSMEDRIRNASESFDISGKVDTNNPIYKFYEKEVGRYLKNNYNAQVVTDAQGVKWWEVNVNPELAKQPITAFKHGQKTFGDRRTTEEIRKLIHEIVPEKDLRIMFDSDLQKDEGLLGRLTGPSDLAKGPLKPLIKLLVEDGKTDVFTAYHEAGHYVFNYMLTDAEKAAALSAAEKEMGPLSLAKYKRAKTLGGKKGYPTKDSQLREYISDKFAREKMAEKGFSQGLLRDTFIAIDKALRKVIDTITNAWNKIKEKIASIPNREGGFIGGTNEKGNLPTGPAEGLGSAGTGVPSRTKETIAPPGSQLPSRTSSSVASGELNHTAGGAGKPPINNIDEAVANAAQNNNESPKVARRVIDKVKEIKTELIEKVQDKTERVRQLLKNPNLKVTDKTDPWLKMTLYDGRVGSRIEKAKAVTENIVKDMSNLGKVKDVRKVVSDYLVAQHAPERNAALGEWAAGMTNEEAAARVAEIKAGPNGAEVVKIAEKMQELHNQTLEMLKDAGVIKPELYDTLKAKYPNHVPLNRIFDDAGELKDSAIGVRGFDVKSTGIKRATGSSRAVEDVFGNIVTNYQQAVIRSEKNIVDLSTLQFVRSNESELKGIMDIQKPRAQGMAFDNKTPIMERTEDPHILQLYENGKRIWIKIADKDLALAFRGVNSEKIGWILQASANFVRMYSGLATRFNLAFGLPNKIRDLQETMIYLAAQKDVGFVGTIKTVTHDPSSLKAVLDSLKGVDSEGARLYEEMKQAGGTTGGFGLSTKKKTNLDLAKLEKLAESKTARIAENIVKYIDGWNTIFEDSTRLSVYKQAIKSGLSQDRAAFLAKEASINFNRQGTAAPTIKALWMFSNPSIQGSAKMLRAMRDPKVALAVTLLVGGAVVAVSEWNDQADPDWRNKVSKWDRLNGLPVVLPSTDGNFRYFTVPVAWGIKPILVMDNYATDAIMGHELNIKTAASDLGASLLNAYNPVGGTDFVSALTPSILDIPTEIARNQSWSGSKIRPDKQNANTPNDILYFSSLKDKPFGQASISISEMLQSNAGVAVSPADIQYAVDQYTSGPVRPFAQLADLIKGAFQGTPPPLSEYPLLSRFYRMRTADEVGKYTNIDKGDQTNKLNLLNQEQQRKQFYDKMSAENVVASLKGKTPDEIKSTLVDIAKSNPQLFVKIKDAMVTDAKGLTKNDKLIESLGVANGERAKYLAGRLKELGDPVAIKAFLLDLAKKKLITSQVLKQMTAISNTK